MKTLLIALLVFPAAVFAQEASETKTFNASFNGEPIMAWTGTEHNNYSRANLQAMAEARANEVCKIFGYESGKIAEGSSVAMVDASEFHGHHSGYVLNEGQLELVDETSSDGTIGQILKGASVIGLLSFSEGRVFQQITCSR